MNSSICANDFWPLILKLSPDERLRLARLALRAAVVSGSTDAALYRAVPPDREEFSDAEDDLAWEADGWEEFDAPR